MNSDTHSRAGTPDYVEVFERVLLALFDTLGADRVDSIRRLVHHSEPEAALNVLMENLHDTDIQVTDDVKRDLIVLATELGALGHPAGKGILW